MTNPTGVEELDVSLVLCNLREAWRIHEANPFCFIFDFVCPARPFGAPTPIYKLHLTKSLWRSTRMTTFLDMFFPVFGGRFLFVARLTLLTRHYTQHPEVQDSVSVQYRILHAMGARRGR